MRESVTWKIGGEAGFGIMSAGNMLARIFSRAGYHAFAINEYPSLIRGGHNVITVRIAAHKFESMNRDLHILAALNRETVEIHKNELSAGALILIDPKDNGWEKTDFEREVNILKIPLSEINAKFGGEPVMRNTVMLGATLALLGADFILLEQLLTEQFRKKGDSVIQLNVNVAREGYDFIKNNYPDQTSMNLSPVESKGKQIIVNGSEALGIGALKAGLQFAAIYPMTPINALITFLTDHVKEYNLVYKQPEDEIAGINMAIGAAIAGARSMVATSGGGFALMVEGVSLSGMVEAPVVIDMGMRTGPATGMPTWTEQGDLRMVIHAGHGEFARIVLAPGDALETYQAAISAFNLADRYQIPVFILTDKYLNESQWCVAQADLLEPVNIDRGKAANPDDLKNNSGFKRYNLETEDGVSPRSFPGQPGGFYIANSYEHDETGYATDKPEARQKMAEKRLKKIAAINKIVPDPKVYGNPDADVTFVSWGTNKGAIIEAIEMLAQSGTKANLIHFSWVYPFPDSKSKELFSKAKRLVDVELNGTAQLAGIIRESTGVEIKDKILKFDGRQFYPEEIIERLKAL
jgi:2-oxoglutarate ferredoxin oxidoreductase subunit alpha